MGPQRRMRDYWRASQCSIGPLLIDAAKDLRKQVTLLHNDDQHFLCSILPGLWAKIADPVTDALSCGALPALPRHIQRTGNGLRDE